LRIAGCPLHLFAPTVSIAARLIRRRAGSTLPAGQGLRATAYGKLHHAEDTLHNPP